MKVELESAQNIREKPPGGKKKKFLIGGLAAALVGATVIGGVLAYQTKTEDLGNIFTIGSVKIEASEPKFPTKDDPEEGRVDGVPDDCELLIPFEEIPKDPRIKNVGVNDCIVFFRVTCPVETLNLINDDGTREKNVQKDLYWMKQENDPYELHENHFNEKWIELTELDHQFVDCEGINNEGKGYTYIFGWHEILIPGKSTETLFDKIQNKKYGSRTIEPDEVENIKIESFAIQSEFVKREGIDVPTTGEISEEDLTYLYKVFVNQNEATVGKGDWKS